MWHCPVASWQFCHPSLPDESGLGVFLTTNNPNRQSKSLRLMYLTSSLTSLRFGNNTSSIPHFFRRGHLRIDRLIVFLTDPQARAANTAAT